MASLGNVIDFLLMLSIGGLAGLVIALHLKLRNFSDEATKVPALADDLTRAITASRSTMQSLANAAKTDGSRLEEMLSQADRTRQELVYVLDRAERVLTQFDQKLENQPVPSPQSGQPQINGYNNGHAPQNTNGNSYGNGLVAGQPARLHQMQQEPMTKSSERQVLMNGHADTPQTELQQPEPQAPKAEGQAGSSKAAIMPGRYQARLGVDQNGRPRPYKPASFQSGAAAYGANTQTSLNRNQDDDMSTTEAESELRRALQNAI